jgi:hypothetical protein
MCPANDPKYAHIPEAAKVRTESLKVSFLTYFSYLRISLLNVLVAPCFSFVIFSGHIGPRVAILAQEHCSRNQIRKEGHYRSSRYVVIYIFLFYGLCSLFAALFSPVILLTNNNTNTNRKLPACPGEVLGQHPRGRDCRPKHPHWCAPGVQPRREPQAHPPPRRHSPSHGTYFRNLVSYTVS